MMNNNQQRELTLDERLAQINGSLGKVFAVTDDFKKGFEGEKSALNMKINTLGMFEGEYKQTLQHVMDAYTKYAKIMDGLKGDDLTLDEIIEGAKLIVAQKAEKAKKAKKEKDTK